MDTKYFETKIKEELALVEKELKTVGRINPGNPKDWEARPDRMDIHPSDENEVADKIESYEGNMAIMNQLEIRFNELKAALLRIKDNAYGICEVSGEPIEKERLEANPAATTCMKHVK